MAKKSHSLTSRARKFVIGISALVTAAIGVTMTPQVSFAAIAITPSDYYANFNGTNQVVDTQAYVIPSSGDFSVQAWVFDADLSSSMQSIVSQGINETSFHIGTYASTQSLRVGSWEPTYTTATGQVVNVKPPVNRWYHIAVTKGGHNHQVVHQR